MTITYWECPKCGALLTKETDVPFTKKPRCFSCGRIMKQLDEEKSEPSKQDNHGERTGKSKERKSKTQGGSTASKSRKSPTKGSSRKSKK